MPEGPEVRVICEYLNKVWSNQTIIGMNWDSKSKFNKTGIKGLDLVKLPCKVIRVFPRGKVIVIECINSNGETIYMISQLGMEGKWTREKGPHANFKILFGEPTDQKTEGGKTLYKITDIWRYDDTRHFGNFNIYKDLSEVWKKHGPCLLTTALVSRGILRKEDLSEHEPLATKEAWVKSLSNGRLKNKQICAYLMEQKYFAGIGNYLRAELLYRARVRPDRTLSQLSEEEKELLYDTALEQLIISYNYRGLTIKTYWDPEGKKGECPLQVYNQKTDPLGNEVVKERFKDKRTTHWVPQIQK